MNDIRRQLRNELDAINAEAGERSIAAHLRLVDEWMDRTRRAGFRPYRDFPAN